MYCPQCGFEVTPQDAKYCSKCGFDVSRLTPPTTILPRINSQSTNFTTSWWKIPLHISLFFFGGVILLCILAALLTSILPNSETLSIVSIVLILVLTFALLIYKAKQWGWGWYFVICIICASIQKTYTGYGIYQVIIHLSAIMVALFAYYAFRQKYLSKVENTWLRSLLSGIIALFVGGFIAGIVSVIVPTQDHRVAKVFQNENNSLQTSLKSFTERNNQLWSLFVSEPATTEDFETNLAIVEDAISLYRQKDSILVLAMQNMYSGIKDIYDETLPEEWSLSFTPAQLQSIVDKTKDIARYDESMLTNLSSYYKSVLSGDGNHEQHWQAYETSQQQLTVISQDYAQIFKQVFGCDITDQLKNSTK